MVNEFQVNIIGVIFNTKNRKILLGKKKSNDSYSFAKTILKENEELDVGLKRVIQEKTGENVHNLGSIYAENMLKNKNVLNLYFLCEMQESNLKEGKHITELIWVNPSEVEEKLNRKLPPRLSEYIINLG